MHLFYVHQNLHALKDRLERNTGLRRVLPVIQLVVVFFGQENSPVGADAVMPPTAHPAP
jgi:hypothetical protein